MVDAITGSWVPNSLINRELQKSYSSQLLAEYTEISTYYHAYNSGAEFSVITGKNYEPPQLAYKKIKALIDKEARFLFSKSPDFVVKSAALNDNDEATLAQISIMQNLVDQVLQENSVKNNLTQAAKDCFIGKRIAIMCNFNSDGIQITMLPSLDFLYDVDRYGKLSKIVGYFLLNDTPITADRRIYCKKYWMQEGYCWVEETAYDGNGKLVETYTPAMRTEFQYIPAVVVLNNGLLEDYRGVSDVAELIEYESMYSELSNNDIDAEIHSMNPIRYSIDMSPDSTKDLSVAAGAFWDLNTDQTQLSGSKGSVGMLESSMSYSPVLTTTLDRIDDLMYNQLEIPNTTPSKLQGIITSGKTLKALYWGMVVRCDEKMNAWRLSLEQVTRFIIEGARLYPESAVRYIGDSVPEVNYEVHVTNQYPLPEDEAEEKTIDMAEVNSFVMSHKSYLKKWHNMTDVEAEEEIQQIVREKRMFEEMYFESLGGSREKTDNAGQLRTAGQNDGTTVYNDIEKIQGRINAKN